MRQLGKIAFCLSLFVFVAFSEVSVRADPVVIMPPIIVSPGQEVGGSTAPDPGVGGERGTFITSLTTIRITHIGIAADLLSPSQTLTLNIYAANGNMRGALLASNSVVVTDNGFAFYNVPIDFTLLPDTDYDIAMVFSDTDNVLVRLIMFNNPNNDPALWREEGRTARIRIRDGELRGDPQDGLYVFMSLETPDEQPIPEPASLILLATGLGATLGLARRRHRRSSGEDSR